VWWGPAREREKEREEGQREKREREICKVALTEALLRFGCGCLLLLLLRPLLPPPALL
jgi:hypothetical protein